MRFKIEKNLGTVPNLRGDRNERVVAENNFGKNQMREKAKSFGSEGLGEAQVRVYFCERPCGVVHA